MSDTYMLSPDAQVFNDAAENSLHFLQVKWSMIPASQPIVFFCFCSWITTHVLTQKHVADFSNAQEASFLLAPVAFMLVGWPAVRQLRTCVGG